MSELSAILVRSEERFRAFEVELQERGIKTNVIDLSEQNWIKCDFESADIVIYYPSFQFSSNSPNAVSRVVDFIKFVHLRNPRIISFPDSSLIDYYNDKYRQCLFLKSRDLPCPRTIPLDSTAAVKLAHSTLGYPMVLKNRYGAGGGAVWKIQTRKQLEKYYRLSILNLWNIDALIQIAKTLCRREFYYYLIKKKRLEYPLLSPPLLAQEFVSGDRDVRVVLHGRKVIEAHWRIQACPSQWKVNIDGGGIGEWSEIPTEVLNISCRVADKLNSDGWLALDILQGPHEYLITEFSPVWHHYGYKEKATFIYKNDYNVEVPLELGLNLEKMIIESLVKRAEASRLVG